MTKICDTVEIQFELYGVKNDTILFIDRKKDYDECVQSAREILNQFPFTPEYESFQIYRVECNYHRVLYVTKSVLPCALKKRTP